MAPNIDRERRAQPMLNRSRMAQGLLWTEMALAALLWVQVPGIVQRPLQHALVVVAGVVMVAAGERWALTVGDSRVSLAPAGAAAVFLAGGLPIAFWSLLLGSAAAGMANFRGLATGSDWAAGLIAFWTAAAAYHLWYWPGAFIQFIVVFLVINSGLVALHLLVRDGANGRHPFLRRDVMWNLAGWLVSLPLIAIFSLLVRQDRGWERLLAVLPFLTVAALLRNLQATRAAHVHTLVAADISTRMASADTLEQTLGYAEEAFRRTVGYTVLGIYLSAVDGSLQRARVWHPMGDAAPFAESLLPSDGLTGWAIESRTSELITDSRRDPAARPHPDDPFAPRSALILPLVSGTALMGMLVVGHEQPRQYGAPEFQLGQLVASRLAVALHQLRVTSEAKRLAVSDPLMPQLANYRYFTEVVGGLMGEDGEPLAVVFLDLDKFKAVNDRYGHQTGDRVLRDFVDLVRMQIRPTDLLARYGGDEFVLLLREVNQDGTEAAIQRIQESTAAQIWEGVEESIGVSAGYALYPEDATRLDRLIDLADSRMYRNKGARKRDPDCLRNTLP